MTNTNHLKISEGYNTTFSTHYKYGGEGKRLCSPWNDVYSVGGGVAHDLPTPTVMKQHKGFHLLGVVAPLQITAPCHAEL